MIVGVTTLTNSTTPACADCSLDASATSAQASVTYQTVPLIPIPGVLTGRMTLTRVAEMRVIQSTCSHNAIGNGAAPRPVEMTLVGIPIIFILISTFEISRGMWMYHTLAYAVKDGVRFASVHGYNCVPLTGSLALLNNCPTTIAGVATVIENAGVGLDPSKTELTFTPGASGAASTSCYLGSTSGTAVSGPYGSLVGCMSLTSTWPPSDASGTLNGVGKPIRIDIDTPFRSAIAMLWPGNRPVAVGAVTLWASSLDHIQF